MTTSLDFSNSPTNVIYRDSDAPVYPVTLIPPTGPQPTLTLVSCQVSLICPMGPMVSH